MGKGGHPFWTACGMEGATSQAHRVCSTGCVTVGTWLQTRHPPADLQTRHGARPTGSSGKANGDEGAALAVVVEAREGFLHAPYTLPSRHSLEAEFTARFAARHHLGSTQAAGGEHTPRKLSCHTNLHRCMQQ